jgi:hypothetical protein
MTICASDTSQKLSLFYLPAKNIIKVLFAIPKPHLSSNCPAKISLRFYLPSQNICPFTHYDHGSEPTGPTPFLTMENAKQTIGSSRSLGHNDIHQLNKRGLLASFYLGEAAS